MGKQAKKIYHGRDTKHSEFPHGELRGFKAGCRCLPCKRARADYNLVQKGVEFPEFRKLLGMEPSHPDFPHGTRKGYKYCKCDKCKKANNLYVVPLNRARLERDEKAREIKRLSNLAYRKTEKGMSVRKNHHAKRKALKRNLACCSSSIDMETLRIIYKDCPSGYHVDHILPLSKGGLHHPDNLQYLPAVINIKKGNDETFDCSKYAIRWQDHQAEPSTTIPQGSRGKCPEMPRTLNNEGRDMVYSAS